jgi:hypothetical protein
MSSPAAEVGALADRALPIFTSSQHFTSAGANQKSMRVALTPAANVKISAVPNNDRTGFHIPSEFNKAR